MHTDKFIGLQSRLNKLRRVYLPHTFDPTGSYSDSTLEKVRAYKVLAHAEMEYYFEEVALSIARRAYQKWNSARKASTPLVSMVAYYEGQFPSVPDIHDGNNSAKDIDWRINSSFASYNQYVRSNNHGIKEKNILNIFLPIGVRVGEIDNDLLIALNSFGAERGVIAHSTRSGAPSVTTPDDALASVTNIMTYIDTFDQQLHSYRSSIR